MLPKASTNWEKVTSCCRSASRKASTNGEKVPKFVKVAEPKSFQYELSKSSVILVMPKTLKRSVTWDKMALIHRPFVSNILWLNQVNGHQECQQSSIAKCFRKLWHSREFVWICISFMHHFHPQISTIQDVLLQRETRHMSEWKYWAMSILNAPPTCFSHRKEDLPIGDADHVRRDVVNLAKGPESKVECSCVRDRIRTLSSWCRQLGQRCPVPVWTHSFAVGNTSYSVWHFTFEYRQTHTTRDWRCVCNTWLNANSFTCQVPVGISSLGRIAVCSWYWSRDTSDHAVNTLSNPDSFVVMSIAWVDTTF